MGAVNSRTRNTIYNFSTSIVGQLLAVIMNFVVRTVFIATLGKSYLGINGLFSNILTMLSLAEFGVGSAILFKLYDPLARQDKQRIILWMRLYKKAYTCIGAIIAILGLCLIPFLPLLIRDYNKLAVLRINAVFIFLLYLLQAVSSYLFWAYKTAIIHADQKEYITTMISYGFTVAASVLQIAGLTLFRSFEVYVLLSIISVLAQNYTCAKAAEKMYPYINDPVEEHLSRREIVDMVKDCGALFLYKLNGVVLKATDNIVISVFLGLDMVGMYSNYYVFYTAIRNLFNKVFNAVSHSLGSLHTTRDTAHKYQIFEAINLIAVILGGTACVGIFVVADEFINVWIGSDWLIAGPFSLLMGIELYTLIFRIMLEKYRNTMGLFQQAKFRPAAGMAINLIASVFLAKRIGVCGVLLGTVISDWATIMWFDPVIIHRHGFENAFPVSGYFFKNIKYLAITALTAGLDRLICTHVFVGHGWASVVLHTLVCGVTVPGAMILGTAGTAEGKYVWNFFIKGVRKMVRAIKK